MTKKTLETGSVWVPSKGDVVTYITPQQKRIPDCVVLRVFDHTGRIRVKSAQGNCYSGTLDQIKP